MSQSEERLYSPPRCPMKFALAMGDRRDCDKEGCAWWIDDGCAVAKLAKELAEKLP